MSARTKLFIDILERAVFTWVEVFLMLVLASNVFDGTEAGKVVDFLSTLQMAALGALGAALAVIKGGISALLIGKRESAAALPADID